MKNFNIYIKKAAFLVLLIPLALISCDKEDDQMDGFPEITNIRLTDPETAELSLTEAPLGATIVVEGNNLGNVTQLFMNDEEILLNPVFVTNKNIIFTVTDSIPTLATFPNVPNTIRVITRNGASATHSFQTLPPPVEIVQISNELAKPGDEIILYGKYFYFVDSVYFPGNMWVKEGIKTGDNGSWMSVTVPEGFIVSQQDRDVHVVTKSGASSASRGSRLGLGEGIVADFDNNGVFSWPKNGDANWGWGISSSNIVGSSENIEPYDGHFGLINMIIRENYAWANEKLINLAAWGGEQIFPVEPASSYSPDAPISNFAAKMEMSVVTSAPISNLEIQVMFYNKDGQELTANVKMPNVIKKTDGTWFTVSIPLDRLANGDAKLTRYNDLLNGGADNNGTFVHHYRVLIINTHATEAVPVEIGIDNMRVENTALTPGS